MQSAPEDPDHIMAGACAKHYVANSMEGTTEEDGEHHDRAHVDTTVSMQDLIDSYMPAFQAAVEKANVAGLMCGCEFASQLCLPVGALDGCRLSCFRILHVDNSVNGVPNCASEWLIKHIARGEWGFGEAAACVQCDSSSCNLTCAHDNCYRGLRYE